MSDFDFSNAQIPSLKPLQASFAQEGVEAELKALFLQIFQEKLGKALFDVNVSGMQHLGTYDLVRKVISADGLVMMQGEHSEAACRYLYRTWLARDNKNRGTEFLKAYLQLLFPNLCRVEQAWQDIDQPYPDGLHSALDDDVTEAFVPDPTKQFLTSRIELGLDLSVQAHNITTITNILRAILPARLVPQFRFMLVIEVSFIMKFRGIDYFLDMDKQSDVSYKWGGLYVTDNPQRWFHLGRDDNPGAAPKLGGSSVFHELDFEKESVVQYPLAVMLLVTDNPARQFRLGRNADPQHAPRLAGNRVEGTMELIE